MRTTFIQLSFERIGKTLSAKQLEQLDVYASLLMEENKIHNLTAIDDFEGIVIKHFVDCALGLNYVPQGAKVCDVGSGAGFPGLVWAILRDDIHVTSIETTTKKIVFQKKVAQTCDLQNIHFINERVEELREYREYFDVGTARAVASLNILLELIIPLVKVEGIVIALKGQNAQEELFNSTKALDCLHGRVRKNDTLQLIDDEKSVRTILVIEKIKKTSPQYPRGYAKIKKQPL
jgi:16S rRNA (guanine527-N7)-methyltransferase